jgi:uncharacterized protein
MIKVVFDTNVLISALFWKGAPRLAIDMAVAGKVMSFTSLEILEELANVLHGDFKVPGDRIEEIMRDILSYSRLVSIESITVKNLRDLDDSKIIATALSAKAQYLVTGDKDLLVVGKHKNVEIVTLHEFLNHVK